MIRDTFGGSIWREGSVTVVNRPSYAVQAGYQLPPTRQAQGSGTSGHLQGLRWDPLSAGAALWDVPFVPPSP